MKIVWLETEIARRAMTNKLWIWLHAGVTMFAWLVFPQYLGLSFFPHYWNWLVRTDPWWFGWGIGSAGILLAFVAGDTVLVLAKENDRLRAALATADPDSLVLKWTTEEAEWR
jgi:hypothetical protein